MMAATERTTSLSRHSSSLSLSASLPGAQKKYGQLTLQSPPPPIPTLPPLFFHILPLSALHSRTPGLMYAFGLTYTLHLLPSFLQKMMMNCWMQRCCAYNLSSSQLPAHASKSTATGFHRRVLACPFQLCRTTHGPRPRSHWIYGWPSGRSDLPVEFCRS